MLIIMIPPFSFSHLIIHKCFQTVHQFLVKMNIEQKRLLMDQPKQRPFNQHLNVSKLFIRNQQSMDREKNNQEK
jgi:hypothetical protein